MSRISSSRVAPASVPVGDAGRGRAAGAAHGAGGRGHASLRPWQISVQPFRMPSATIGRGAVASPRRRTGANCPCRSRCGSSRRSKPGAARPSPSALQPACAARDGGAADGVDQMPDQPRGRRRVRRKDGKGAGRRLCAPRRAMVRSPARRPISRARACRWHGCGLRRPSRALSPAPRR